MPSPTRIRRCPNGNSLGMDDSEQAARRDDPVEGGALDDEGKGELADAPATQDDPVESGALEDD